MASGTSMLPFADTEIKMRWREPYVTEGLNKKLAGITPRGIYRGFRLGYNGAPMLVEVLADPDKGDHVAVYETNTAVAERYSMRVELTGGDFTLNLTPWPSQLVYIAIYAEYSTLGTTSASLRVYTEAEYAGAVEKDELIILGTVNVPALGVIAATSITGSYRTLPVDNLSSDAKSWVPLLRNAGFETGMVSGTLGVNGIPWHRYSPESGGANYAWGVTDADSYEGERCAQLTVQVIAPTSWSLYGQDMVVPVNEGQRIKWRFVYKPLQTAAVDNLSLRLYHLTDIWGVLGYIVLATLDSTVTGSWIVLEGMIEVPSGVSFLNRFYVGNTGIGTTSYPALGAAIRIDSMQLWAEPTVDPDVIGLDLYSSQLFLQSYPGAPPGIDPVLRAVTEGLKIVRKDEDDTAVTQPSVSIPGQLELGRASGFSLDTPVVYRDLSGVGANQAFQTWVPLTTAGYGFSYRQYFGIAGTPGYWINTLNAAWRPGTSDYEPDMTGLGCDAIRWHFSNTRLAIYGQEGDVGLPATPIPWDDLIALGFIGAPGGSPIRQGYLYLDVEPFTGVIPDWLASDFDAKGRGLYTRNMCKMWAKVRSDGANPATVTVLSGFNVTLTPVIAGGAIRVYPQDAFLDGLNMSAVANALTVGRYACAQPANTGQYVDVFAVNPTTGVLVDLDDNAEDIDVHVYGVFD